MTHPLEAAVKEVNAKLVEIQGKLAEVDAAAPGLSRFAVDASPMALFWDDATKTDIASQLTTAFTDATAYTREAIEPFARYGAGPGFPWALREDADKWLETFSAHAAALADDIMTQSLLLPAMAEESWDSAAREAYEDAQAIQMRMIDALTGVSATFETALRELAGSQETFWWAMLACVLSILIAILGLVAGGVTAVTIIGIPIGIAIFIAGVVAALVSILVPFVTGFTIASDQQRHIAVATSGLSWTPTPFSAA